jgi:hypothetical protein
MAFFSKTDVMIKFFAKTSSSLSKKNTNIFAKFFGENNFKIITSVPGQIKSGWLAVHRRKKKNIL